MRRAQTSNGAADTSTELSVDAEDSDETEEALEAKMQEFLRQQALQESGEHLGVHIVHVVSHRFPIRASTSMGLQ